jgi:hypothetical protein
MWLPAIAIRARPRPGRPRATATHLPGQPKVRHTVIRVITDHLNEHAAVPWQGLNFDFAGVLFDGGNFFGAKFSGGEVDFSSRPRSKGLEPSTS